MKRIALEEHFVLDEPEHWERSLTLAGNVPRDMLDRMRPALTDIGEGRIAAMSEAGIDYAILSNIGTVQGTVDATHAMRLARQANDRLARAVADHPDRFGGFATVPLQDVAAGADELERSVRDLGLKGTMIFGHTDGAYLDDERFLPFWERAEALDVPVYLHAADPAVEPTSYRDRPELIGATWSWTAETAAHALRLIFGGVFGRHPKLKVFLGHMGEALPYLAWRIDAGSAQVGGPQEKPSDILRRNFAITTASMFSDDALLCALRFFGDKSIMFSVDYPFGSMSEGASWLDKAPISEKVRECITYKNADMLLSIQGN